MDFKRFSSFPWASLGRPETFAELREKLRQQQTAVSHLPNRPKFSWIVPWTKVDGEEALERTLGSLLFQSYPDWECFVVGRDIALPDDSRIRRLSVVAEGEEARINEGARAASGEWLGVLRPGTVLSPITLFLTVIEASRQQSAKLFYSHEALFRTNNVEEFYSKASFSPFTLRHFNYLGETWMVRTEEWARRGGLRTETAPHAFHDFILRLNGNTQTVRLLPFFLVYRPCQPEVRTADETLKRVVEEDLARNATSAKVWVEAKALKLVPDQIDFDKRLVTAILCFRDRADWTVEAVRSLSRHSGRVGLEILLIDNESKPSELEKVRAGTRDLDHPVKIVSFHEPFNFGQMHNWAVKTHARGEFLFLLNNDVFWRHGNLEEMIAWADLDWIGTVGMCLRYGHGDVQHAGVRAFFGGAARLARLGHDQKEDSLTFQSREVFANTFAACAMKRSTYESLGGLRAFDLPNGFGDIAFNLECVRRGLTNVYLGHLQGVHLESASRGETYEYWEELFVEREYPDLLQRMLREDLGFRRVPASDLSIRDFAKTWALVQVRRRMPWLKPVKTSIKQLMRQIGLRGAHT